MPRFNSKDVRPFPNSPRKNVVPHNVESNTNVFAVHGEVNKKYQNASQGCARDPIDPQLPCVHDGVCNRGDQNVLGDERDYQDACKWPGNDRCNTKPGDALSGVGASSPVDKLGDSHEGHVSSGTGWKVRDRGKEEARAGQTDEYKILADFGTHNPGHFQIGIRLAERTKHAKEDSQCVEFRGA